MKRQLAQTDQLAAQHNLLSVTVEGKQPRTRMPLVLQDTSHLNLVPEPKLVEMFREQRERIEETVQAIRTLTKSGHISPGDQAVYIFTTAILP